MRTWHWVVPMLVLAAWLGAQADRGSIPFKPTARIFEPNQRAMIAWNGTEEILLLSTELRASEETQVLEVIPLPGKPTVKKGDMAVFQKATDLINRKLPQPRGEKHATRAVPGAALESPAGAVVSHEKIGAHDITVVQVLHNQGFIDWVEKYLKDNGVEQPVIPATLKKVINQYLAEKFTWFVFDVVALDTTQKTNDAIQYRFPTKSLFYPLKISQTDQGNTDIDLLILTPRLLSSFPGEKVKLRHQPISITSAELRDLNADMDALLNHRNDMKLRIWRLSGDLSSFKKDLLAR